MLSSNIHHSTKATIFQMFNYESDSPNWEMKQSIKLGKTLSFTKIHGVESFGSIEGNESDTIRKNISFNEVISSGHR